MEQERPHTPEKQLLKLIEDSQEEHLSRKEIQQKGLRLFSLAALKGRLSFLSEKLKGGLTLKRAPLDIGGINQILKWCLVGLSFYLGGSFLMAMSHVEKTPDFDLDRSRPPVEIPEEISLLKKPSYYLEKPRSRDIFRFGEFNEMSQEEVAPPGGRSSSKIEEAVTLLRLVGIGWSDDPDVMIEDTGIKQIYFLKRGQWIEGKIKVEAIFKDRVILSFEGEEAELR